jgi:phosphatidylserine/phosphatidylglycerophosphate/cardiolipin synthase-like enzyme
MELHFNTIKPILLKEIESANFLIYAAVAWISDFDIIKVLTEKMKQGVQVELIINDDDTFVKRRKVFEEFRNTGGRLFLYKNESNDKSLMHHKFCVIDLSTTITGSFNWSFSASSIHKENIIIARDNIQFSKTYAIEFLELKKMSILFDGKRNNFDASSYAKVTQTSIQSADGESSSILAHVQHENKFSALHFKMCQFILDNPPKVLFGFWRERLFSLDTFNNKDKVGTADEQFYYNFECLDPTYLKYLEK